MTFPFYARSQSDSAKISHFVYISFDDWRYDDTHTMYGYGFSKGKHNFHTGISLGRKRLISSYYRNYYYDYLRSPFGTITLKDTSFSLTTNAATIGYSYIFKDRNRFTFFPFANIYINYFRAKGTFVGIIDYSVNGTDNYKVAQWHYLGNLGWGCRFTINARFTAKMEIGAGLGFVNTSYESDHYGTYSNWDLWSYALGRIGVYYRFK